MCPLRTELASPTLFYLRIFLLFLLLACPTASTASSEGSSTHRSRLKTRRHSERTGGVRGWVLDDNGRMVKALETKDAAHASDGGKRDTVGDTARFRETRPPGQKTESGVAKGTDTGKTPKGEGEGESKKGKLVDRIMAIEKKIRKDMIKAMEQGHYFQVKVRCPLAGREGGRSTRHVGVVGGARGV